MDTIIAEPLTLAVPLGDCRETDLMAALEFVVTHWIYNVHHSTPWDDDDAAGEVQRATAWLHAKYGFVRTLHRAQEQAPMTTHPPMPATGGGA